MFCGVTDNLRGSLVHSALAMLVDFHDQFHYFCGFFTGGPLMRFTASFGVSLDNSWLRETPRSCG